MTPTVYLVATILAVAVLFIGGLMTTYKMGMKEGLVNYNYIEE